jgi:hypothetical protein
LPLFCLSLRLATACLFALLTPARLSSQIGSLITYLEEEADLGAEGGGKLRSAILAGANSGPIMSALRAMAIFCDSVLWPLLRAIKPTADKHTLDVLPRVWPKAVEFFKNAAARPKGVIDGTLKLTDLSDDQEEAAAAAAAAEPTRNERARLDIKRILEKAAGDALVQELVGAACAGMAEAAERHASEWLGPDGKLCKERITPELRRKYDALPTTSTSIERLHAFGRDSDEKSGLQRADTRAGICLARYNGQVACLQAKSTEEMEKMFSVTRPLARRLLTKTMRQQRVETGQAKRAERDAKLSSKRARRQQAAMERDRIEKVVAATKLSELKSMDDTALADQLKRHKQVGGKKGLTTTQPNRAGYVRQIQMLMLATHGNAVNDLPKGDLSLDPVGVQRRARGSGAGG